MERQVLSAKCFLKNKLFLVNEWWRDEFIDQEILWNNSGLLCIDGNLCEIIG